MYIYIKSGEICEVFFLIIIRILSELSIRLLTEILFKLIEYPINRLTECGCWTEWLIFMLIFTIAAYVFYKYKKRKNWKYID